LAPRNFIKHLDSTALHHVNVSCSRNLMGSKELFQAPGFHCCSPYCCNPANGPPESRIKTSLCVSSLQYPSQEEFMDMFSGKKAALAEAALAEAANGTFAGESALL